MRFRDFKDAFKEGAYCVVLIFAAVVGAVVGFGVAAFVADFAVHCVVWADSKLDAAIIPVPFEPTKRDAKPNAPEPRTETAEE